MNNPAPVARSSQPDTHVIDGGTSAAAAAAVAEGRMRVELSQAAGQRIAAAHARMAACIAEMRLVYGVTTGFGPLADRIVAPEEIGLLQENLVNHLASGVGPPMPWAASRAMALARLCSIACGWSGASVSAVRALIGLLNSPLAARVPEKGTVGASGDLTPLAHLALALMGRGAFIGSDGATVDDDVAFALIGAPPLSLRHRDGLALVNGTSAMTGQACLNAAHAARLIRWGEALTAATAELLRGRDEAWSAAFAEARPHPGQRDSAARLRLLTVGAPRIDASRAAARIVGEDARPGRADRAPQDAYTLRCAPQVLGAARDAAEWHRAVTERELNSATDNPIFPADGPPALHGGNFMGQHVALASDALSGAVIVTANLAERQIARLTDERLNEGLPAFLHRGPAGLNSGFMGAQVTASALIAEMRTRAVPAAIQSISTNGANQDVVSMGTIAARAAAAHLTDARRVHAILALAAAQGMDIERLADGAPFGPAARALADWVRARAPEMPGDRPLSGEIERVAAAMAESDPPA